MTLKFHLLFVEIEQPEVHLLSGRGSNNRLAGRCNARQ